MKPTRSASYSPCQGVRMPTDHFDGASAEHYDADHADRFADDVVGPTVEFLASLLGDDPRPSALELAIGTGRIALPLGAAGVEVDGVDLSAAMLRALCAKPGGDALRTEQGDMATVDMGRTYGLVYLVFNTIGNVMTQDAQVACFRNAARHLEPGGHFVVECSVPAPGLVVPGAPGVVFDASERHVGLDRVTDLVAQQAESRHFQIGRDGRVRTGRTPYRFVWPSELDLMAQLADMGPVERWADWHRAPFVATSPSHVSVWRRR